MAGPYISAEVEYRTLCAYLLERHYTDIAAALPELKKGMSRMESFIHGLKK